MLIFESRVTRNTPRRRTPRSRKHFFGAFTRMNARLSDPAHWRGLMRAASARGGWHCQIVCFLLLSLSILSSLTHSYSLSLLTSLLCGWHCQIVYHAVSRLKPSLLSSPTLSHALSGSRFNPSF